MLNNDDNPRVGVVSISPTIKNPSEMDFSVLYEAIGKNTGNFMFTQAVFRQLAGHIEQIGFNFDPAVVNQQFDYVIVPAANWLNPRAEWDWLTALIDRIEIPVITIGIGLQAETTDPSTIKVSDSSIRLAHTLSRKAPFISTRGQFTTSFLQSIGIMNAVTTGCPSLYMSIDQSNTTPVDCEGLVFQSTRYGFTRAFLESSNVNRLLFQMAAQLDADIIFQSEPEEIDFLVYNDNATLMNDPRVADIVKLYGAENLLSLKTFLLAHGRVFFDVDQWSQYICTKRLLIGTRLHGAIVSLNSGTDALLISHDSRTSEMIDFAKIPTIAAERIGACRTPDDFLERISHDDQIRYFEMRDYNAKIYKSFLTCNGVKYKPNQFNDK